MDFVPDALHHVEEAIQLSLALALRGLDHQGTVYGEGERGGMVAEVHQTLGDVALIDAAGLLEAAAVEDEFVPDTSGGAGVDDAVGVLEANGHVVGIEDRCTCGTLESLGAK